MLLKDFVVVNIKKNVLIDRLDDIVNKHNNTYQKTIKMKNIEVQLSAFIVFDVENDYKNPTFNVDLVKI